ncbi:unnamed protein product [Meganyctiphanes norvegica]|uniref:Uncharacterized protein n=1 Tax=Meganyctiphanes norvegica TaxID=48144 RepID=A0AAV2QJD3_MEGNR
MTGHCGSGSGIGNQAANDAAISRSSLQPQQPQQITSAGAGRTAGQPAPNTKLFYLKPALRECFACVGATNKQYPWKEVLQLLGAYIKLKNIISTKDPRVIDCKNDPLSSVLGVDSFAYGREVISLFINQVIPVEIFNDNTVPILTEPPISNIRTPSEAHTSTSQRVASVASTSTFTTDYTGKYVLIAWNQCIPEVPAPAPESDTETIFSYQGYQTASCHNTEYEESEAEEVSSYEEYELASDDAQEQGVPSEDNETDIENVFEVVNIDVYNIDVYSEEDWADEDSSSSDEDPDLACFSWACLSCGIKNQPYVNYCEQCWKVRKDIHPDRPRRRKRRKSRGKKNKSHRISEKQSDKTIVENFLPPASFERSVSLDSSTLLSMSKKSQSQISVDYTSSQDSGIGSQDFLGEDLLAEMSDKVTDTTKDSKHIKKIENQIETTHQIKIRPSSSNVGEVSTDDDIKIRPSCSNVGEVSERKNPSVKKRRRSSDEEVEETKRKKNDDESEGAKKWPELLQTDSFKEWFMSEEGHKFLYSKEIQDVLINASCSGEDSAPVTGLSALCSICLHRPKNGSIVHGRISHIATCYPCARRLLDTGSRCPVCRRKIHMVTKTIVT